MSQRFFLDLVGVTEPTFAAAGDASELVLDKPSLRTGVYRHPTQGWTLDIDAARLARMATTVNTMIANGVTVDVTVDHSRSARDKLGRVTAAQVVGDWLVLRHEFADAAGVQLAKRVGEVSVEIEQTLTDGIGRRYDDAITANSIVRKPVVPGQQPFTRIAASRDSGPPVWYLSHADGIGRSGRAKNEPDPWVQEELDRTNAGR